MEDGIKGKVIAITCASSKIGEAIAVLLSERAAKVVLGVHHAEQLHKLVIRLTTYGEKAAFAVTDVTCREDLNNLVSLAILRYGKLDVFINNAGISLLSRFDDIRLEEWEEMIDVNLKGVLYGIAASLQYFENKVGVISLILSQLLLLKLFRFKVFLRELRVQ